MKGIDLGRGRLVFIPDARGGQMAFDFGGAVDVGAGPSDLKPKSGPNVEVERAPAIAPAHSTQGAPCIAGGGFENWLREAVVEDLAAAPVETGTLYRSYLDHFAANGFPSCCQLTLCKFGQELTRRGYAKRRGRGAGRIERVGLRVIDARPVIKVYRCARSIKMARGA